MSTIIKACSRCGSVDLNAMPGGLYSAFTAYGLTPLSGQVLCNKCNVIVLPIEFENKKHYEKFLKQLAKGP